MRVGELLLQRVDAVKSEFSQKQGLIIHWFRVEELPKKYFDSRKRKPSIKNAQSLRNIPIDANTARILTIYAENYRKTLKHPFLLNSARDTPLSQRQVNDIFAGITKAMPANVIKELENHNGKSSISPHDLRHTCVVNLMRILTKLGTSTDLVHQKLRTFFGWSIESNMPRLYARSSIYECLEEKWSEPFEQVFQQLRSM